MCKKNEVRSNQKNEKKSAICFYEWLKCVMKNCESSDVYNNNNNNMNKIIIV